MIRIAEHLIFGSLAVAGHLAVFGITGGAPGPGSAMDGPAVIMEAAPIELAALVQRWTAAPDVSSAAPDLLGPNAPSENVALPPIADTPPALAALPRLPLQTLSPQASAPDVPNIDTAPAKPPRAKAEAQPAPKKKQAKKERPETLPTPKATQTAPAQKQQDAAGGGGEKTLMSAWGKGIMKALARQSVRGKSLPKGTVTLALTIDTAGHLLGARIARSSGHAVLDQAALAAVSRARFPAAPKGLSSGKHAFTLPVASR